MGLLRSATAFEAYCKVYTADLTPDRILEFLLLDEEFPHSLRFSIDTYAERAGSDPGRERKSRGRAAAAGSADGCSASLSYSSVEEILSGDVVGVSARTSRCSAARSTTRSTSCTSTTPSRPHWRGDAHKARADNCDVLLDSPSDQVPLQQPGQREHDGDAHASALRQNQRCLTFHLSVSPRCRVFSYRDHLGEPGASLRHSRCSMATGDRGGIAGRDAARTRRSRRSSRPMRGPSSMRWCKQGDYWEMLLPSEFAAPTPALDALAEELDVRRRDDPLMVLHELNEQIYEYFDYKPKSTKADSPIDLALATQGRRLPGLRAHHDHAGAVEAADSLPLRQRLSVPRRDATWTARVSSATHAWVEALLPQLGWVGFDPTNWLVAGDRHIRTAIGRDYCRCAADPRHLPRPRQQRTDRRRARDAQRGHTARSTRNCPCPRTGRSWWKRRRRLPEQPPPPTRQQQMAQQQQDTDGASSLPPVPIARVPGVPPPPITRA